MRSGEKVYEGRLNRGIPSLVRPGHHIIFFKESSSPSLEFFTVKVEDISAYPCFRTALNYHQLDELLPGIQTTDEALVVYRSFCSEESQLKYGVVIIKIKLESVYPSDAQSLK